jgi:hypothetical protein
MAFPFKSFPDRFEFSIPSSWHLDVDDVEQVLFGFREFALADEPAREVVLGGPHEEVRLPLRRDHFGRLLRVRDPLPLRLGEIKG